MNQRLSGRVEEDLATLRYRALLERSRWNRREDAETGRARSRSRRLAMGRPAYVAGC